MGNKVDGIISEKREEGDCRTMKRWDRGGGLMWERSVHSTYTSIIVTEGVL